MTLATLVLDFAKKESSEECKGLKLELPEKQVCIGDDVEIRLFGALEALDGWRLQCGLQNLGPNELGDDDPHDLDGAPPGGRVFTQLVDFAETSEAQLDWPVQYLMRVTAITDLMAIDENGNPYVVKPRGWSETFEQVIDWMDPPPPNVFQRKGYSCIRIAGDIKLFGSISVMYRRVRWYRRWLWRVPQGAAGKVWFFLYSNWMDMWETGGSLDRKFSIELPDLVTKTVEYKTILVSTKDSVTEAAIPGATIYIDDLQVGVTDADANLLVHQVLAGKHTFRATAPGHLSTDEDNLSNEEIVV